jgi:hypothetical protein
MATGVRKLLFMVFVRQTKNTHIDHSVNRTARVAEDWGEKLVNIANQ